MEFRTSTMGNRVGLVGVSIFLTSEVLSRPVPGNRSGRGAWIGEACEMDSGTEKEGCDC
jgi:hypothetical protein